MSTPKDMDFLFPGHDEGAYEPEALRAWQDLADSHSYDSQEDNSS